MNRGCQGLLDSQVLHFAELLVKLAELWPLFSAKNKAESGEVEGGVEADLFVVGGLSGLDVEVDNSTINVLVVLESGDEGTDVLERGTSHKL